MEEGKEGRGSGERRKLRGGLLGGERVAGEGRQRELGGEKWEGEGELLSAQTLKSNICSILSNRAENSRRILPKKDPFFKKC